MRASGFSIARDEAIFLVDHRVLGPIVVAEDALLGWPAPGFPKSLRIKCTHRYHRSYLRVLAESGAWWFTCLRTKLPQSL